MTQLIDLLQLEYKKFKTNNLVRLLIFVYLLFSPFVIFFGKDLLKDAPPPLPNSKIFYEFPTVWDYQGYVGNWLVPFCLGFLVIYFFTSEVSNKTLRQNILTGMTKKEIFISKLLGILVMSVAATILFALSTIVIGMVHTDGFDLELIFDNNWASFRFFLLCLGYMSFAYMVAILIRKGMLAILFYFLYIMILEPIIMTIHVYYFTNSSRNYYPMNSFEDLMPLPLFKIPDFFSKKEWDFSLLLSPNTAILMSVLYITIFLSVAYYSFQKRDI